MNAGQYAKTVKVGPKGQVVIPKAVRDMFGLNPGDLLLLLADVERGIALVRPNLFEHFPGGGPDAERRGKEESR